MKVKIPLRLVSESNIQEHWSKKHRRNKKIYQMIAGNMGELIKFAQANLPILVTLTRIAPRKLDDDNLRGAMKHVRDAVANLIIPGLAAGRADGDGRIGWLYAQEQGGVREYALGVEVVPVCMNPTNVEHFEAMQFIEKWMPTAADILRNETLRITI